MRATFSKGKIESEMANRFGTAFKLNEKPPAAGMSTGIAAVDSITGGLPRGAITEIFGSASSGRTSFMLSALARATTQTEVCALIDTNDVFDPLSATDARLDLDQLVWIRCASNLEHAFKATDMLLQGRGFGLIILDIGDVPPRDAQRIISSWWYRFRRTVENTPTAFLVIAQESCARSCASLTLEMKREVGVWSSVSHQLSHWSPDSVSNYLSPATGDPSKRPPHSNLFRGLQLQLTRQKPIPWGEKTHFRAAAPHLDRSYSRALTLS